MQKRPNTISKTPLDSQTLTDVLPKDINFTKRGLALKWRVAILTCVATALLGIGGTVTAYLVVGNSLVKNLEKSLSDDAELVQKNYSQLGASTPTQYTGGIIVQLYGPDGTMLESSQENYRNLHFDEALVKQALVIKQDYEV
ncbi:MAG: hypothetical protein R2865_11585 [Deinococcales bacterium]